MRSGKNCGSSLKKRTKKQTNAKQEWNAGITGAFIVLLSRGGPKSIECLNGISIVGFWPGINIWNEHVASQYQGSNNFQQQEFHAIIKKQIIHV